MRLSPDLFRESWLFQEGFAEGLARTRVEGMIEGLRLGMRMLFELRFPDAGPCPDLDHLTQIETLDRVFIAVIHAPTSDEARSIILAEHSASEPARG